MLSGGSAQTGDSCDCYCVGSLSSKYSLFLALFRGLLLVRTRYKQIYLDCKKLYFITAGKYVSLIKTEKVDKNIPQECFREEEKQHTDTHDIFQSDQLGLSL